MPKKKYRPEDIINKLREADVMQAEGMTVAEVVKILGIHEQTYYRGRR
jgi:putative transposase